VPMGSFPSGKFPGLNTWGHWSVCQLDGLK